MLKVDTCRNNRKNMQIIKLTVNFLVISRSAHNGYRRRSGDWTCKDVGELIMSNQDDILLPKNTSCKTM